MTTNLHEEVLSLLKQCGAIITNDHLVYKAGDHGSEYVNKDALYPHVAATEKVIQVLAGPFNSEDIDTVIAPAVGAILLGHGVARYLTRMGTGRFQPPVVASVYAEKNDSDDTFEIRRGYDKFISGRRVLVVEDVLNSGGSVNKVVVAVRKLHGTVVGVRALCNRGGVTAEQLDVPELSAVCNVTMEKWPAAECLLCKQGKPINTSVGHGKEFLAKQRTQ